MATEQAFLQAIREHPEDDLPRLVFADWLDEHGQPGRAEFIRIQCELAKPTTVGPRHQSLKGRSDELEAAYRREWVGLLQDHLPRAATFRRGFVDRVYVSDSQLDRAILPALHDAFSRHPVTHLEYDWSSGGFPDNRVSELLSEMTTWTAVRSLRRLELCYYRWSGPDGWDDGEIEQLAGNPHLSNLTSLRLRSDVSPGQLAQLGRGTFAGSLQQFHAKMGFDCDHREWCRAWKQLPFLPRLTDLDLGIDWHTDDTLAALLDADLPAVQRVNLHCNDLTEGALAVLERWPRLRQIHSLELMANNLGPNLPARLAELPADSLRALTFGGEMYRNRATHVFVSRPGPLDPEGCNRFAQSPLADRLSELMVMEVAPGGPLLRALSAARLSALTELNLASVDFEPDDLRRVFAADWFDRLRLFRVGREGVTDDVAELFLDCPLHPEATLSLYFGYASSRVSADMRERLRNRFGTRVQLSPE